MLVVSSAAAALLSACIRRVGGSGLAERRPVRALFRSPGGCGAGFCANCGAGVLLSCCIAVWHRAFREGNGRGVAAIVSGVPGCSRPPKFRPLAFALVKRSWGRWLLRLHRAGSTWQRGFTRLDRWNRKPHDGPAKMVFATIPGVAVFYLRQLLVPLQYSLFYPDLRDALLYSAGSGPGPDPGGGSAAALVWLARQSKVGITPSLSCSWSFPALPVLNLDGVWGAAIFNTLPVHIPGLGGASV